MEHDITMPSHGGYALPAWSGLPSVPIILLMAEPVLDLVHASVNHAEGVLSDALQEM
jgi:hypothetical protein